MPTMDQDVLAVSKRFEEGGTIDDPRYEQLLMEHHYVLHECRMPLEDWPDPSFVGRPITPAIHIPFQDPASSV
jgi:proline iminopeptidase